MLHRCHEPGRRVDLQTSGTTCVRLEKGSHPLKPAPFTYESPETTTEVIELLRHHGPTSKILAGGQSLVPLLSFRLVRPDVLIDLKSVPDLDYIVHEGDGVRIGALTRHRAVELNDGLTSRCQIVGDAMAVLGHVAIRNQGTVGGSLAHADPAAEWPALALVLDGQITILGQRGVKSVSADDFFTDYMGTVLGHDELITELRLDLPGPHSGSSFQEMAFRHGDFAQAGAGVALTLVDGRIDRARIALLGLGPTPVRPGAVEEALIGEVAGSPLFERVSSLAQEHMEPFSDVHADADYKRHVGTVMLRRALDLAHKRAIAAA